MTKITALISILLSLALFGCSAGVSQDARDAAKLKRELKEQRETNEELAKKVEAYEADNRSLVERVQDELESLRGESEDGEAESEKDKPRHPFAQLALYRRPALQGVMCGRAMGESVGYLHRQHPLDLQSAGLPKVRGKRVHECGRHCARLMNLSGVYMSVRVNSAAVTVCNGHGRYGEIGYGNGTVMSVVRPGHEVTIGHIYGPAQFEIEFWVKDYSQGACDYRFHPPKCPLRRTGGRTFTQTFPYGMGSVGLVKKIYPPS